MNRKDIRERIESALQDQDNRHWSDRELNTYIDDALTEFTRVTRHPQIEGDATNPGSTTALGEATQTGTLTVDGKTAKITFSGSHGYSSGDVLLVADGGPSEYLGPFNILVPSTTTVTYKVNFGDTVTDSSVSVFRIGPTYTKPSTIAEVTSVSINGRELAIYSESQLNAAASSRGSKHYMLESRMGFHPNAFSSAVNSVDNTPKWREQYGPIEAVIFNNRTSSTFRIYPLPKENLDIYEDKDATTKVFLTLKVRGVPLSSGLSSDTSTPTINAYWHEGVVFGALERAWLKEGQVKSIEKSQMYRMRFIEQMNEAKSMEGMSSTSISEGRNRGSMVINRYL